MVGSSSTSTGASWASARPTTARWNSPPDSVSTRRSAAQARSTVASTSPACVVAPRLGAEQRQVRRAPEQHVLGDGQRLRDHRLLRHERDHARPRPADSSRKRPPVQGPPSRRRQAARRSRAAARTCPPPLGPTTESHAPAGTSSETPWTTPPAVRADVAHLSASSTPVMRPAAPGRRRTNAKNGAPIIAVMTPIGSSPGATTVRASTSHRIRNDAPNRSDSRPPAGGSRRSPSARRAARSARRTRSAPRPRPPPPSRARRRSRRSHGRARRGAQARGLEVAERQHLEQPSRREQDRGRRAPPTAAPGAPRATRRCRAGRG